MTVMIIKGTKSEQRPGFIVQFTCRIYKESANQQDWDDDGERNEGQSSEGDAQRGRLTAPNGQLVGREDGHWKVK